MWPFSVKLTKEINIPKQLHGSVQITQNCRRWRHVANK
jgi:hypothetical protein